MKKFIFSVISAVMVLALTACMEESLREKPKIDTESETATETQISERINNNVDFNDGKSVFDIAKNITFDDEPFEFPITTDKLEKKYKSIKTEEPRFTSIFLNGKNVCTIDKEEKSTFTNAYSISIVHDPGFYSENNEAYCIMKIDGVMIVGLTKNQIIDLYNDYNYYELSGLLGYNFNKGFVLFFF